MNNINNIFFELIQVAIGNRKCLSLSLSADEWGELYDIAKKQCLLGVCFAGVQKLTNYQQEPPEMLYFKWMGMAAKIQQRNEVVNRQCVELQERLMEFGVSSVVLKGQGIAQYYYSHLRGLRQSGDIDIFVKGNFEKVISVALNMAPVGKCSYVHADWKVYDDTEVELHYRPSTLRNLLKNRFLQKWANTFGSETYETRGGIVIPSTEFNRVYLLLHCYRHIIGAGIGLRQLMDYYFCLNGYVATADEQKKTNEILNKLGLKRFAGAVMYVLEVVFGLDKDSMICAPNTVEGEYLLKQIVIGGNFGRYDGRAKRERKQVVRKVLMNLRYIFHYPNELIWALPFRIFVNLWEIRHTPKHTSN